MTTARALLRRLIFHGRLDPRVPAKRRGQDQPPVGERLEAARQRLKQTIPPPEGASAPAGERQTIPPPEGVSPGEESPPVLDNPP